MDLLKLKKIIIFSLILFVVLSISFPYPQEDRISRNAQNTEEELKKVRRNFPKDPSFFKPIPLTEPKDTGKRDITDSICISYDIISGMEIIHDRITGFENNLDRDYVFDEKENGKTESNIQGTKSLNDNISRPSNFSDLELITNPEEYPWRVNVKLQIVFPGGIGVAGSGVLVDPMHVITAGHCVHNINNNGWAESIRVIPGFEWDIAPYGDAFCLTAHAWSGWVNNQNRDYDVALIDLDRPVGALTGWNLYSYNDSPNFFTGNTFNNVSYPAEPFYFTGDWMYYWYGNFDATESTLGIWWGNEIGIYKMCYEGQSGSGAYIINGGNRVVYAVLSNRIPGPQTNFTRISSLMYTDINTIIAEDTPSMFDLIPLDVSCSPSNIPVGGQFSSMSYLIHNYSSSSWSGTVSINSFLSTDDDISTADINIGNYSFYANFSGKSSVFVTVPNPPIIPTGTSAGNYYVGVILNVSDFSSSNNASGEQDVFPITVTAVTPTVTTNSVSSITTNSAVCGGNVTSDGGAAIIARGVCWSISLNPTIYDAITTNGSGTGSFTSNITGLNPGTTYHVRAYGTNSQGTAYGIDRIFTTGSTTPTVTTNSVSSITTNSAVCGGNVTSDGGAAVTARGVCWSTNPNPTTSDSKTTDGSGTGSFTSNITGLNPGTTYHVRAYATNSQGTAYGIDRIFTTGSTTPTVTTNSVSSITTNSAVCGGNVTSDGGAAVAARGVCWSTNPNPTTSDSKTTDGSGTGSFTSNITGLNPGTTYHVRAYATNNQGTAYGSDRSFATGSTTPTVTTNPVSSITTNSAVCGGNVTSDGGSAITARGVCWSTNLNPTTSDAKTTDGSGTGSFTSNITGLNPGTTYHVRAYATNNQGTSYGSDMGFNTGTATPTVTTNPVSSITTNSAVCGGNVTSDGGSAVTARGVCWSTNLNPTTSDAKTTDGSGTGSFTSIITGLNPGTTYHVRAYATNNQGTSYGEDRGFSPGITTPTVTINPVSSITSNSAICGGNVTSDGGAAVTARGVCWSTNLNPTISDFKTTDGSGTGSFTSSMTGLNPGTTYHVRAYATNSQGTAYGSDSSFITPNIPILNPPNLISPGNNAVVQLITLNLTWSDTNSNPQEQGYKIRIRPAGGSYTYYNAGQNATSYQLQGLNYNTTYYWNVQAMGNGSSTSDSQWANSGTDWLFTTANAVEIISPPSTPSGPSNGFINTIYLYSSSGASSNLGHALQYLFDWGDGTDSGWLPVGTLSASHSWAIPGSYTVKAKARCSVDPSVESPWSTGLTVVIIMNNNPCVLIVDLDVNNNSALEIKTAVEANNQVAQYATEMPQQINPASYPAVFICLGIYPYNHVLNSQEGDVLKTYLDNGGNLYVEGGDTWAFDQETSVHPYFGISGAADGSEDTLNVTGITGVFTQGLSFAYEGDNKYMDRLNVADGATNAFTIWQNQTPSYNNGIARDTDAYKTIGASFEFGGIPSSQQNTIMGKYLNFFFEIGPAALTVISPNGGEKLPSGKRHNITWQSQNVNGPLEITLLRNGLPVGSIAGNVNPAAGSYSWIVGQYIGGTAPLGAGYKIKIKDKTSAVEDMSNAPFTITGIQVASPNGGESWQSKVRRYITWKSLSLLNNVNISLWRNGEPTRPIANNIPRTAALYNWVVGKYIGGTALPGTGYKIKINEIGTSTEDMSNGTFAITGMKLTSPNGSEIWRLRTVRNITWSVYGIPGNLQITLWRKGVYVGVIANNIPISSNSFAWTVGNYIGGKAPAGTAYTIKIKKVGATIFDTSDLSFTLTN